MAVFRQYIAPFLVVVIFLLALIAVSARIFLPSDMAAPAPVGIISAPVQSATAASDTLAGLPPSLAALVKGLPDDPALSQQL